MVYAAIVAGGSGTRMKNAPMPKQFLPIGGEPVIIKTVRAFLSVGRIDRVIVGIKPDCYDYTKKLLEDAGCGGVLLVGGGKDRNSTVKNIIDEINSRFGIQDEDIILTHDAVRPFVSAEIIEANISAAAEYGLCGTYIPSADTVISSQSGAFVDKTLDRRTLYQAQTPQSFALKKLFEEMSALSEEQMSSLTDTCSVFTRKGMGIRIVPGDRLNFKITTDKDLALADALCRNT